MAIDASRSANAAAVESTPADPVVEARRVQQRSSTRALQAAFRHDVGVAYGPHPRQVMDVYYPATSSAAPVLVFLHGGGFRGGEPSFHGYQGRAYLERGSVFVSMGYRLTPEVRFPDTCEDVEQGLAWLNAHIGERGGNPGRMYVAGHSAGAMLAAAIGLRELPAELHLPADLIKGLVLISGMYNVENHADEMVNTGSRRYVGDLSRALERVPDHTILIGGDQDFPAVLPDARALQAAIQARGGSVDLFVEPDADHFAANRGFATPGSGVAQAVARMLRLE